MMEKVKSALLFFLVGLSLLLTYQLWYGEKPAQLVEEDIYERILVEEPRSLENVLTPGHIVLRAEEGSYIFKKGEAKYDSLWDTLSLILQQIRFDAAMEEEALPEDSVKVLAFYLDPVLPVGEELPWLPDAAYTEVSMIEVYSNESQKWLALAEAGSNNEIYLQLSSARAAVFSEMLEEVSLAGKTLYTVLSAEQQDQQLKSGLEISGNIYVPLEPVYMDELNLRAEDIDRSLILKTFFVDYNMARIIEEKDGGLIYTDGDKGLRLTSTGLEYSSPQKEEGQVTAAYPDALFNSSSLISYHGGWPESLRLEELNLSGWGRAVYYNAKWNMYYNGFPIFTRQPTRALFNDNGLIHYNRSIFVPGDFTPEDREQKPVAAWNDALDAAVYLLNEQAPESGNIMRLEELCLGYAVRDLSNGYRGQPVWRIKINGKAYILDAYQLEPIRGEDLL